MDSIYLLDTNILSEPLKKIPDEAVLEFLEKNETYIKSVLETLPIFEYDTAASIWHAKEKARLIKLGKTPSFVDGQIASIAHTQNLKLVTKNSKDFKPFKIELVSF